MRAVLVALAWFGLSFGYARRMHLLDERSTERASVSAKALASFLMSSHSGDAGRGLPRFGNSAAGIPRRRISELSRIRGGAGFDGLDGVDEDDLLNIDVGKAKPAKPAAPTGKMQMPSADEIQQIMNDPQYQEQLKKMMSDPNFQEEMRKAAEQMKEMLSPEDMAMLEQLKNDPSFQEHAKQIADQMASDPEFMKAAEKQAEMMQDMIEQTLKDPAMMKQIQLWMSEPSTKEHAKTLMQEIAQVLPADKKEELSKLLVDPDLEEKINNAKTLEELLKKR
jgi:hypothetical protein